MKRSGGNRTLQYVVRGGLIAALYVALTYLSALLGLSSGVIQFRLSEALCVLAVLMPEAIPGLTVGCFIANLVTGCAIWDVIFGSIATLIGALGAYLLRRVRYRWLTTLPTVIANSLIVPGVLILVYGEKGAYLFFMMTVMLGEVVCATLLGTVILYYLEKMRLSL